MCLINNYTIEEIAGIKTRVSKHDEACRCDDCHDETCRCDDCFDTHEEADEYDEATGFND